jgi:hypothetical protein
MLLLLRLRLRRLPRTCVNPGQYPGLPWWCGPGGGRERPGRGFIGGRDKRWPARPLCPVYSISMAGFCGGFGLDGGFSARGRTTPARCLRSGAARAGCRLSEPHPYLHADEFPVPILWRGFPAGTMDACAGRSRHDVPSCRQDPAAAGPGCAPFIPAGYGLTVPDRVRPGPARWLTGSQSLIAASIVSRRAGRCSDLVCGTGMHRIRRGARIRRGNRRKPAVCAAGVVPVTNGVLFGLGPDDRPPGSGAGAAAAAACSAMTCRAWPGHWQKPRLPSGAICLDYIL